MNLDNFIEVASLLRKYRPILNHLSTEIYAYQNEENEGICLYGQGFNIVLLNDTDDFSIKRLENQLEKVLKAQPSIDKQIQEYQEKIKELEILKKTIDNINKKMI